MDRAGVFFEEIVLLYISAFIAGGVPVFFGSDCTYIVN